MLIGNAISTSFGTMRRRPLFTYIRNYAGKVKNDGDNSRLMWYGNNTSLMAPSSFANEVGGGYSGSAVPEDGNFAVWQIDTPTDHYPQFMGRFDLSPYGSRAEVVAALASLKFRIRTKDALLFAFDHTYALSNAAGWARSIQAGAAHGYVEIELADDLGKFLDSSNNVRFGIRHKDKTTGSNSVRLEIDYIELVATFKKQMI